MDWWGAVVPVATTESGVFSEESGFDSMTAGVRELGLEVAAIVSTLEDLVVAGGQPSSSWRQALFGTSGREMSVVSKSLSGCVRGAVTSGGSWGGMQVWTREMGEKKQLRLYSDLPCCYRVEQPQYQIRVRPKSLHIRKNHKNYLNRAYCWGRLIQYCKMKFVRPKPGTSSVNTPLAI